MSDDPSAEERLLDLLNRLQMLGTRPPPFEEMGITPSQFILLDRVAMSPGCGVREIARGLGVTSPTVSVGVRRLEEARLVERQPNPQDKRSIRLFLTPQGEALHRRVQAFRYAKARRLLSSLTHQEQETLLSLWERALDMAEAAD
ncbi:MAG TPA: MarR family transcriptional regulator [Chloroflexi bacterium]|nr:MarR family transcriptional regulator [Chloroflexota bacterium]